MGNDLEFPDEWFNTRIYRLNADLAFNFRWLQWKPIEFYEFVIKVSDAFRFWPQRD
jgi:hypothetical protein